MATYTKRGSRWLVQIRRKGFVPQTRTFATKADAVAWATVQEAKVERGEEVLPLRLLRTTTLADIIDRYLKEVTPQKRSASTELARLTKLKRDPICSVTLAKLSSEDVAKYRDRRLAEVLPGTVRRELSLLHHSLELARKEWGFRLSGNPVKDITHPKLRNARDRRLEPGELERLYQAVQRSRNPDMWPIIAFAIETALRRGELLNLSWECVDLDQRTAHIPQTKTGKPRTIPFTDAAIAILKARPARSGLVFPVTPNAVKLAWVRATKRADLYDLHFHDLRHEAISRFFELGLSLPEVAVISGHRDPRMLFRYTHLRPSDLAQKLAGRMWSSSSARMNTFNPAAA